MREIAKKLKISYNAVYYAVYYSLHRTAQTVPNQNRKWTSFRRNFLVSGHFEPVLKPTNADAPDTQLV